MNRLEKTLVAIFFAGAITLGVGLYRNNNFMKNAGVIITDLGLVSLAGYGFEKFHKNIYQGDPFD